ncbi:MAG: CehA/McbA family metallohydrolase [Planctomycetes bacterium]|nr:CehA/McbA family metallohydrolase [Planctomycetota bacterium]MBL7037285.1 CehA/McbA family metallohydrolase [Pirellulaceae bacterium]
MQVDSVRPLSAWWSVTAPSVLLALASVAPAAELRIKVVDEQSRPLPCRVLVRPAGGDCIMPEGAVTVPIPPDKWFACVDSAIVEVPEGDVLLRVERGLEYVRFKQEIKATAPETTKIVTLRRWIDMRSRGYMCGENHVHVAPAELGPMLVAEGLDFGTSLTWWNGPDARRPIPAGSQRVSTLEFAGQSVPSSVFDAELEYGWGAAYIQNLPAPMPIETDRARPNLDYVRHACEVGGLVSYQAGWSREVLLDALLGYVHVVNICNNNFHMHRFQPRSHYSNLLQVPDFPVYDDTDQGMMRMNTDTYYRLLNCGLKLATGAGTAIGVKPNPVGYNRAYIRVAADASLQEFNKAWAAGKNFVTNGPMIFLKTGAGQKPGDTIDFSADGDRVSVELTILSDQPLTSAEVVVNGQVVHTFEVAEKHQFSGTAEIDVRKGSWLAARCTARDDLLTGQELSVYRSGADEHRFRQRPSRLRFAHTSPIYLSVDGQDVAVPGSIREGLLMLDHFERFTREQADDQYIGPTTAAIEKARESLRDRLEPQ